MVMIIISIILAFLSVLLANTVVFNSLMDDWGDGDLNKIVKIILFIPPFAIITSFVFVFIMFFCYIVESFKKLL
jgi:hypothetical protein